MSPPLVLFDYEFSPYGQKIRLLLAATQTSFQRCDQPPVIPRPTLENMGITYRRIPVLAVGKDIYCDTLAIVDKLQEIAGSNALATSPADKAYEAFGARTFWSSLPLVPEKLVTKEFAEERKNIFPILSRPDFGTLKPSALGEFKNILDIVENEFLAQGGQWIGGEKMSLADVHAVWVFRWVMLVMELGKEAGFTEKEYPKVHKWLQGLPTANPETLSDEDATKAIMSSDYAVSSLSVDAQDPLGLSEGTKVSVEATDTTPGAHPQLGKLVGLSRTETVIELENGLRLHFPRLGYVVRKA